MDVVTNIRQRFAETWRAWSSAQRSFFVGALCVCVAFACGLTYWLTQPAYVRLASDLPPARAAEITTALESAGIDYDLSLMGSSIMVAREDLARARGVMHGAVSEAHDPEGTPFGSFGVGGEGDERTRELEVRIARTIAQLAPVQSAVVNIGRPDPSPWIADQKPTTASVLVVPRPNREITSKDAAAIVDIVSRGIDGLDPANISVVDSQGRRLNASSDSFGEIGYQQDYTNRVESILAAKAENVLRPLLGAGNVIVVVTAEIDFNQVERTTERPDASSRIPLTERIISSTVESPGPPPAEATGTDSNLQGNPAAGAAIDAIPPGSPTTVKTEETETTYAESSTIDHLIEAPGAITRLSVSALVDVTDALEAFAEETSQGSQEAPPTKEELEEQVRQAIEAAVGFDQTRSDTIQLTVGRIIKQDVVEVSATEPPFWTKHSDLLHNIALAIAGLSAFLLGWMILRRLGQPVIVKEASSDEVAEAARRLSIINSQVRDDPELVAKIMSNWLGAEEEAATNAAASTQATRGRRAA